MIGEAVDTAVTLGWALAVWIVLLAFVASLALWSVVVVVWAVGRAIWRVLDAAWAAADSSRAHSRRCGASGGAGGGFHVPTPERPSDRRTELHTPAWARKDAA